MIALYADVVTGLPYVRSRRDFAVRHFAGERLGWVDSVEKLYDQSQAATFQRPSAAAGIILAFWRGGANQSVAKILVPEFLNTIGGNSTFTSPVLNG
jgi:hypothetical protein